MTQIFTDEIKWNKLIRVPSFPMAILGLKVETESQKYSKSILS